MASDDFTGTCGDALDTHDVNWEGAGGAVLNTDIYLTDSAGATSTDAADRLGVNAWRDKGGMYASSSEDSSELLIIGVASAPSDNLFRGPAVRMTTSIAGYALRMKTVVDNNYTIAEVTKNGGWISGAGVVISEDWSVDHTLKLTASGTTTVTLTLYIDDVEVHSFDDSSSPVAAGSPGFWISNQTGNLATVDSWTDGAGGVSSTPNIIQQLLR